MVEKVFEQWSNIICLVEKGAGSLVYPGFQGPFSKYLPWNKPWTLAPSNQPNGKLKTPAINFPASKKPSYSTKPASLLNLFPQWNQLKSPPKHYHGRSFLLSMYVFEWHDVKYLKAFPWACWRNHQEISTTNVPFYHCLLILSNFNSLKPTFLFFFYQHLSLCVSLFPALQSQAHANQRICLD